MAFLLLLAIRAAPVLSPAPMACSDVNITRTSPNMTHSESSEILAHFLAASRRVRRDAWLGAEVGTSLAGVLANTIGGFWDVAIFDGQTFSYSMYCLKEVELAGAAWHVILCQEAIDEHAHKCGPQQLAEFANGTVALPPRHASSYEMRLAEYQHYADEQHTTNGTLSPQRTEYKKIRVNKVAKAIREAMNTSYDSTVSSEQWAV